MQALLLLFPFFFTFYLFTFSVLGQDVPLNYVKPYDKVRDKAVRRIHKHWEATRGCWGKSTRRRLRTSR